MMAGRTLTEEQKRKKREKERERQREKRRKRTEEQHEAEIERRREIARNIMEEQQEQPSLRGEQQEARRFSECRSQGESYGVDHVAGNVNPVAVTATVVTDTECRSQGESYGVDHVAGNVNPVAVTATVVTDTEFRSQGESYGVDHVAGNVNPVAVTATVVTDTEMCYYGADELQRPEDLERIASDKGFLILENQGLGNCVFYALVEQLQIVKGIEISHEELRVNLVQFLWPLCGYEKRLVV
ncbi:hypothetical protein ACROYT_G016229 [Oculina patagonica]